MNDAAGMRSRIEMFTVSGPHPTSGNNPRTYSSTVDALRINPEIENTDAQQQRTGDRRGPPVASPDAGNEHHKTDHGAERGNRKG